MLLYNVTVIIEEKVADHWCDWMKNNHIPQLMDSGCFQSHQMFRIIDSPNEGVSFSVQFTVGTERDYESFKNNFEQAFIGEMYAGYPDKLVAFSTVMEII